LPWAPVFGSPSPSTRIPAAFSAHLVAEMVQAAVRVPLKELGDRRAVAERLKKLDLGVGQGDEDRGYAVVRLRHRCRNVRAEHIAIDGGGLTDIGHRDRYVIEPADHACNLLRRQAAF
jgi:hypothetical protein